MEWDEDEIVVEITADVVEVEIAETATDVSIDEEKIELEVAAPEENTLEITEDLIELELAADPEIVLEVGEGKAVWGFITGELGDQEDLAAALSGKSDTGHTHDDRYYTEQEIDAALAVINAALAGKSDVGHTHDDRYYTRSQTDAALAVITAALAGKSDVGHIHDDRYYTEQEIDAALAVINAALAGKSDVGHTHDDRYYTETETDTLVSGKVSKSGDTMTGDLTLINDKNLLLKPSGASSDASGDIAWYYGNGQEKMRLWAANAYTAKSGPSLRMGKKDGTQLFSGTLSLSDHTHGAGDITSGTLPIERGGTNAGTAANARKNLFNENLATDGQYLIAITDSWARGGFIGKSSALSWIGAASASHTHNSVVGSNNTGHTLGMAWSGDISAPDWFCAWGPQTGYSQVVRAISAANTKKRLSSVLPSIKRINKNIGDVTMGSGGYKSVSSFKPAAPSGYTFMFCVVWNWNNTSNPNSAFGINANGEYMYGAANSTITSVVIAYFYVLTENMTSTTG